MKKSIKSFVSLLLVMVLLIFVTVISPLTASSAVVETESVGANFVYNFEGFEARGNAVVFCGWCFDRNSPSTTLKVHVYVGGSAGSSGAEGNPFTSANVYRRDVNNVHGCGDYHGFDATVYTSKRGTQGVYFYAVNPNTGESTLMFSANINFKDPSDPKGCVDSVSYSTSTKKITVKGWAYDADCTSQALTVNAYVGGSGTNGELHSFTANTTRTDVNSSFGCGSNHGFDASFTTNKTGTQTVYLYAKNIYGGSDKQIGSGTVNISVPLSGCTVTLSATSYTYDGYSKTPSVTVKDGSTTLTKGTHYNVSYSNNVSAGTATVTVTGIGIYSGTVSKTFTISKKSISGCSVSLGASSYTYSGSAKTPSVTVTDGSTTLTKGTHYTVSYSNNVNAGTATATISGTGNYTGSVSRTFTIEPKSVSNCTITLNPESFIYDGAEKTPSITVTDGSTTLTQGTHYTVSYSNNTAVGSATVTISGTGNYTGTQSKSFAINGKPIADCTVTLDAESFVYNGEAKTPSVTVKDDEVTLEENIHYTVSFVNNINAGTGSVIVSGIGQYAGTVTKTFTIDPSPISECVLTLEAEDFTYDGTPITPAVTVVFGSVTLTENADYTVAYSNNTEVGTASVTVSGMGNFNGTLTKSFTIHEPDEIPPVISKAEFSEITRDSFKLYVYCTDNSGVDRLTGEAWTQNDKTDKITCEFIRESDGVYYTMIQRAELAEADNYRCYVSVAVYDAADNCTSDTFIRDYSADTTPDGTVDDVIYRVVLSADTKIAINADNGESESNTNISVFSNLSDERQTFSFALLDNGFYKIIHLDTGKAVSVFDNTYQNNTNIVLKPYSGDPGQQWVIHENDDGSYTFVSRCNGLAISACDDDVRACEKCNSLNQSWYLRRVISEEDLTVQIKNATFRDGASVIPNLTVSFKGEVMLPCDYDVSNFSVLPQGGKGSLVITGRDNFCDSVTVRFEAVSRAYGDIDNNASVSVGDATTLQMYLAKYSVGLTAEQLQFADVNGDGRLNIRDVTEMQRIAAELTVTKRSYSFTVT